MARPKLLMLVTLIEVVEKVSCFASQEQGYNFALPEFAEFEGHFILPKQLCQPTVLY